MTDDCNCPACQLLRAIERDSISSIRTFAAPSPADFEENTDDELVLGIVEQNMLPEAAVEFVTTIRAALVDAPDDVSVDSDWFENVYAPAVIKMLKATSGNKAVAIKNVREEPTRFKNKSFVDSSTTIH